jgi:hypothetical protein
MDVNAAARSWRIACHEASHATIARLLSLPAGGACVEEPNAHAKFRCNDGAASVIALMSGIAAETVLFGSHNEAGARTDVAKVHQRLEALGYTDGGAELWGYTQSFVRQHLGLITFLASVLQRERMLDGDTITAIVDACVEPEPTT